MPEALCVVSLIGEPGFYGNLLEAAQDSRFLSMECVEEMLQLAYAKPFPAPNHEVYLRTVVCILNYIILFILLKCMLLEKDTF